MKIKINYRKYKKKIIKNIFKYVIKKINQIMIKNT